MHKAKYIFRLDDICPTMNWGNFSKLQTIFEKYDIKPILGVIPNNQDTKLDRDPPRENFWQIIQGLQQKGWIIAQHGYQHTYVTKDPGIIGLNKYSEFAGLPYEGQYEKIKQGKALLEDNLKTAIEWWMAPAHSFDENTCKALKELHFKYLTDGIALFPFKKYGLNWIPQQIWKPERKLFGIWTICIHPNSIDEDYLRHLERFVAQNLQHCIVDIEKLTYREHPALNSIFRQYWDFKHVLYQYIKK